MTWDYNTYMSQPNYFIELVKARFRAEGKAQKYLDKKYGRK